MATILLATPATAAAARSQVEALAAEGSGARIVGRVELAGEVPGALEAAAEPVDVVVLHEELGPVPVLELARDLNRRYPDVALLLLAERDPGDELVRGAMFAGVRGIITTGQSLDEFNRTLTNAAEWASSVRQRAGAATAGRPRRRSGRIVAVAGGKGGVGCTVTATSLALAFAADPTTRVCLVDLDLQAGDVRTYLDTGHERSVHRLVAVASELTDAVLSDVLYRHPSGLRVLLPPLEGELGEDVDTAVARQVLGALRARFDVVVVDVGATMNEASATAVEIADLVAVVTTPDLPSMRGTNRLLALWDRLSIRQDRVVAIANRVSRDTEIQPDVMARILDTTLLRSVLGSDFRGLEGPVNAGRLEEAPEAWREVVARLAGELEQRLGAHDAPPAGPPPYAAAGGPVAESGQSTVEFVALLPLLLLVVLLLVQGAVWGWTRVQVQDAAREGARRLELSTGVDASPQDGVFDDVVGAVVTRLPEPYRPDAQVLHRGREVEVSVVVPSVVPVLDDLGRTVATAVAAP